MWGDFVQSILNVTVPRKEIAARYQQLVNETQLPRLNQVIRILGNEILDSEQHFTYLIIDDLDKEWVNEKLANQLIRCLFQAVIDMLQVRNLKILIALRTNIFQQLEYGAQSRGGQEEKFRGSSFHLQWKVNDLRELLNQRAEVASRAYGFDPPRTIEELLPKYSKQQGEPLHYILERTLLRPRDAIQFLNECLRESSGNSTISWKSIVIAERRYSIERLRALRDEWKDPYLDIDKVFEIFRRKPSRMSQAQIMSALDDAALLQADEHFLGNRWLTPLCDDIYAAECLPWYVMYGPLVRLLYSTGFLGLAKSAHSDAIFSYQDEERAQHSANLRDGTFFVIHRAFHQALDIDGCGD